MKNRPSHSTEFDHLSRRQFVRDGTVWIAGLGAVARALSTPAHGAGADGKIRVAFIGAGGRANANISELTKFSDVHVAALCDVNANNLTACARRFPAAKTYRDFRILLDQEKDVDAVVISTPDHIHAVATMAAIKRGKHVYCEKPLTRTIHEARTLAAAARKAGVAAQMGNQGMAFEGNRLINEWIGDGAIGTVREVHAWSDRPTRRGKLPVHWAQGIERPTDTPPVPEFLDWDLWLGPAPQRPYHPAYVPFAWRGWWDFGSGGIGDMGIHNLAPVFSALKLAAPLSVHTSSTPLYPESVPLACVIHFEFPGRAGDPPVKLHWYDGGLLPERPDELPDGVALNPEDGVLFVGDKGKLLVEGWGGASPRLIPEKRMQEYQRPPKTLPRSVGHWREWVDACKTGSPTRSNFDFAGPLTEAVLLGSLCVRQGGGKLIWDGTNMKITNVPKANEFLHYPYRDGWSL